jgi:hypothetical protein
LHLGTAFADDDKKKGQRDRDDNKPPPAHPAPAASVAPAANASHPSHPDHPSHPSQASPVLAARGLRTSFRADLGRVSEVTTSDYVPPSAGTDSLASGMLRIVDAAGDAHDGRVLVSLRGAPTNTTLLAQFVRFNDKGRETIGSAFTTDASRNYSNSVGTLSGDRRVGIFVLIRQDSSGENGKDEFVTTIHT